MSGAEGSNKNRFAFSTRIIPGGVRRAQVRSTLTYRFTPRLQAGVEVNPRSTLERVNPLVNWLAVHETLRRPAVIVGSSSDRIGTPGGQSFYATASKNLKRETKLPIAPYFGLAYGTYEDRLRFIGGINIGFTESLSSMVVFDGVHVHPMITFSLGQHVFTLLAARGRHPGVSYSISF